MEIEMSALEAILDRHYEHTQESAKAIFEALKNGSKNYGELNKRLVMFKKAILFQRKYSNKYESIFIEIDKMLKKEMNDLLLTNRSNWNYRFSMVTTADDL